MKTGPMNFIDRKIVDHVAADLEPSMLTVHTKILVSAVCGGLLSLFICGQFGINASSWADAFNENVHEHMGPLGCAVTCGTLYAVFPISILRFLLCHPLQFKVITRRHWLALTAWFIGFGAPMAYFGHHGDALGFSGWVLAAVAMAQLFSRGLSLLFPSWNPETITHALFERAKI